MSQRDELAFLRSITADPSDDTVRLVYADWLEEHGKSERAEFIRVQIELSQIDEAHDRWDALKLRETELFTANQKVWEDEILERFSGFRLRDTWDVSIYRRGFPHRVYIISVRPFLLEADRFLERVPAEEVILRWTHDYDLEEEDDQFGELLESSQVVYLTGLKTVGRGYALEGIQRLLQSDHAPNLRQLDTHDCDYYGTAIAEVIAEAHQLNGLESLDLAGNQIQDEGLRLIAESPHLGSLTTLMLGVDAGDSTNRIGEDGVIALANSRYLKSLECLDLNRNEDIGNEGVKAIARSKALAALRDLNLFGTGCDVEGVIALAKSRTLRNLRRLSVGSVVLTDDAARAMVESKAFANLVLLDFDGSEEVELSEQGKRLLRERFGHRIKGLSE